MRLERGDSPIMDHRLDGRGAQAWLCRRVGYSRTMCPNRVSSVGRWVLPHKPRQGKRWFCIYMSLCVCISPSITRESVFLCLCLSASVCLYYCGCLSRVSVCVCTDDAGASVYIYSSFCVSVFSRCVYTSVFFMPLCASVHIYICVLDLLWRPSFSRICVCLR